jgi:hypothetical protein
MLASIANDQRFPLAKLDEEFQGNLCVGCRKFGCGSR